LTLSVVMSLHVRQIRVLLIVTCHTDFISCSVRLLIPVFTPQLMSSSLRLSRRQHHLHFQSTQPTNTNIPQRSALLWLPTRQRLFQLDKEADTFNEMKSLVQSTSCEFECYVNMQSACLKRESFASIRFTFVQNISMLAVLTSTQHAT
jgi:hypothetical protein